MHTQKALIVGINHYDFASPLTGCINDALQMQSLLERHGDNEEAEINFNCTSLISGDMPHQRVTRPKLFAKLEELLLKPEAEDVQSVLFYFSGHGKTNAVGGYLVTQETSDLDEGFSVADLITMANKSKVKEVAIILDCCFSGSAGKVGGLNDEVTLLRKGVSILTATTDKQVAIERAGLGGEFTHVLREGLKGLAADYFGEITLPQLYQFAWLQCRQGQTRQTPTLKANLHSNFLLRKVEPEVRMSELKDLSRFFPHARTELRLHERYKDETFLKTLLEWERMGIAVPLQNMLMNDEFAIPKGRAILTQKGQFIHKIQQLQSKKYRS